jgi:hypothetical protein
MNRLWSYFCLLPSVFLLSPCRADPPASQPSDPALNFLLSHATTAPSDAPDLAPATQPSILVSAGPADVTRPGSLVLSNGQSVTGRLSTTLAQPIRLWDDADQSYHDIPFSLIRSMDARVVQEWQQQEWEFAQSGADAKQFTGKTYPVRETQYSLTFKDGTNLTGGIAAPIYFDTPDGRKIYVLHKRDKGSVGQALTDLIYVKSIRFTD